MRKTKDVILKKPDSSVLKNISFPSATAIQPDWIVERHPQYSKDHGMAHELKSIRVAEHAGHAIRITTQYLIEIDGQTANLHLSVGNDGHLHCHTTPYETYVSAIDVVKTLIDRFPEAFNRASNGSKAPSAKLTDNGECRS